MKLFRLLPLTILSELLSIEKDVVRISRCRHDISLCKPFKKFKIFAFIDLLKIGMNIYGNEEKGKQNFPYCIYFANFTLDSFFRFLF